MNNEPQQDDVQDPAEPKEVGTDVVTEEGDGGSGEGQDAAPVQETTTTTTQVTENRAADVGGEPADRWSGTHPDNVKDNGKDDS